MLKFEVSLQGTDSIPSLTEGQISKLVRSIAARVRSAVVKSTPVGNREGKGTTRKSWTGVSKVEGGYSFQNPLVQAMFLEFGSKAGKRPWPTARKRTVYHEGRVYSSQAPEGITARAEVETIAQEVADELLDKLLKGESLAK